MPFPKAKAAIPGLRPHTRYTRMSDVNARSRRAPTTRNKARANTGACDRRQEQALSQGLHRASPSPRPYPTDRPWPLDPRGRQSTDAVLSRPRREPSSLSAGSASFLRACPSTVDRSCPDDRRVAAALRTRSRTLRPRSPRPSPALRVIRTDSYRPGQLSFPTSHMCVNSAEITSGSKSPSRSTTHKDKHAFFRRHPAAHAP